MYWIAVLRELSVMIFRFKFINEIKVLANGIEHLKTSIIVSIWGILLMFPYSKRLAKIKKEEIWVKK